MLVTMLQNEDVACDIYRDAIDFYIYISVYRFKWSMIYIIMFTTLYVVTFTLLFIRENVVKPINKLTNLIIKPDKTDNQMTKDFVKMVKVIEKRKKRRRETT